MRARFHNWARGIREGLWFVPALMTLFAALLAVATLRADTLLGGGEARVFVVFTGGAEGARAVLSAIAGTMITVTGVVFSVTIVALQLASSQFTPRVLRTFTRDRANQLVLGVLIGTFTYTLLVLLTVRSPQDDEPLFVPSISISVAIALALVAVGFLIYYIHHAARSIQASVIIDRAAKDSIELVEQLFPAPVGQPAPIAHDELLPPEGTPALVLATEAGYLRAVDAKSLFDLADEDHLTIRMEFPVGEFVLPGCTLAALWPAERLDGDLADHVRGAFVLGPSRTLQSDLELGVRQLADIAIRALSPGINDPTTATICIDRLAEVLVRLGNRDQPEPVRTDESGRIRLITRSTTFERILKIGFGQIRHYGAGDPTVISHLLETLGRVTALVPPDRRPPLIAQARTILEVARTGDHTSAGRVAAERAGAWAETAQLPALSNRVEDTPAEAYPTPVHPTP